MRKLLNLLRGKPRFTRVLLALFVSGLGTAFTSVAVYQQLSTLRWGPFGFGVAFAAGILPGLFTSSLSGRRAARWPVGKLLLLGQIIGLTCLIFPFLASFGNQIGWLLVAEVVTSAVTGLILPVFKSLERASFADAELPTLASLDTFLLSANFIFGQGLGSLLISSMSLRTFLIIDAISYAVALILLWPTAQSLGLIVESGSTLTVPRVLNFEQRVALTLMIWLPLVTVPVMVVLPSRGAEFGITTPLTAWFAMTPALLLICGRTLGQILGPLLAVHLNMDRVRARPWSMPFALFLYIAAYSVALTVPSLFAAVAFCLMAHVASNVVYAIGGYQVMKAFSSAEIGWASGLLYRSATLVMGIVSLVAGLIAERLGLNAVIVVSLVSWFGGSLLWRSYVARA